MAYLNDISIDAEQIEDALAVELDGFHAINQQNTRRIAATRTRQRLRLISIQQCSLINENNEQNHLNILNSSIKLVVTNR